MRNHGGRVFGAKCKVMGREAEGAKFLVHKGVANHRVTAILKNGLSDPNSEKVPSHLVYDIEPAADPRRPMKGHAGTRYAWMCQVKGRESDGWKYIVHPGYGKLVRVIDIKGNDAVGDSYLVDGSLIIDRKATTFTVKATVGEHTAIYIPAQMRDQTGLKVGNEVTLEARPDRIIIWLPTV